MEDTDTSLEGILDQIYTPEQKRFGELLDPYEIEDLRRIQGILRLSPGAPNVLAFTNPGASITKDRNRPYYYIVLLTMLKGSIPPSSHKYLTIADLLNVPAYQCFSSRSLYHQGVLAHFANWMNVLFQLIPAKQNKLLALAVVTKFVEGLSTRYVTGSGQTQATADRVLIYETEGGIKARTRKRATSNGNNDSNADTNDSNDSNSNEDQDDDEGAPESPTKMQRRDRGSGGQSSMGNTMMMAQGSVLSISPKNGLSMTNRNVLATTQSYKPELNKCMLSNWATTATRMPSIVEDVAGIARNCFQKYSSNTSLDGFDFNPGCIDMDVV